MAQAATAASKPSAIPEQTPAEALAAATKGLFNPDEWKIKLRDGTVVTVGVATFASLSHIITFLEAVVAGLSRDEMLALAGLIEDRFGKGAKPSDTSLETLVQEAFGRSSLVMRLVSSAHATLPSMAESLCDIPPGKFATLPIDEAGLLTYFIFERNHAFFSQTFAPALIQAMVAKGRTLTQTTSK